MPKFLSDINNANIVDVNLENESKSMRELWSYWDNITSASRLYGGKITANGNGTINIEAGGGLSKPVDIPISGVDCDIECAPPNLNDGQGGKNLFVTWNEVLNLALVDNAYNYIYYEGSSNSIKTTTNFYAVSFTRDFTLGRAFRTGNNVVVRLCGTNGWNFNRRVQLFGEEVFPVVTASGLVPGFSERNISFTAGVLWAELVNRFTVAAFDSSVTTFTAWYRNGSGGWTSLTGQSLLNNTQWDDGSGTLQSLLANRVGVHWFYAVHDGSAHVVFGQGNYTQAQADAAPIPATLPPLLEAYATLVGKFEIVANATTIQSVESPQSISFAASQVTNHNDLSNIQGGVSGEYFHLSSAEITKVQQAATESFAIAMAIALG
jgi:hypothetical protein